MTVESDSTDRTVLPPADPPFGGRIEMSFKDSQPDFPKPLMAPAGPVVDARPLTVVRSPSTTVPSGGDSILMSTRIFTGPPGFGSGATSVTSRPRSAARKAAA